ncbi:MAG: hypothetical protein CMI01_14720 [Oceanospirillaceae bacterium]|nr:hypothetical protein [Oceanospirillaceae bacterium]
MSHLQRIPFGFGSLLLVLAAMLLTTPVRAALEPARIEAYIATLPAVRELGETLKSEGKQAFLARQIMPRAGEPFDPHHRAVQALQQGEPDYFRQLESTVLAQGFTSATSWANTGDQVVLAYGAVKVSAESPEMLALSQQGKAQRDMLLQTLPPQQREQLRQALTIADALAQVSGADREAVRPYIAELDRLFAQD